MRTELRPELAAIIPARMRHRPIDARGYTVPWFVEWIDGKPDFRVMDRNKWMRALRDNLCWLCGEKLGTLRTFVIGPMCVVNRITSEPACHRDCAEYAARGCPFLTIPDAQYRDSNLPAETQATPGMVTHNPTACALYTTRSWYVRHVTDGAGARGALIRLGPPEAVQFWHRGRPASRAETLAALNKGLDVLRKAAEEQGEEALGELLAHVQDVEQYLPHESFVPAELPRCPIPHP